ncbi:MAG: hypothetical protein WAW07_03790 [Bacteroidales bacterium]
MRNYSRLFTVKNGNTVVIVTAGQEASGMLIAEGSIKEGKIKPKWAGIITV